MKKVIITLAKKFPVSHKRSGELTYFRDKVVNGFLHKAGVSPCDCCKDETRICDECFNTKSQFPRTKIHTIRRNISYWTAKCDKVNNGEAELFIRQWQNRPYIDPQDKEFCTLNESGYQLVKIKKDHELSSASILKPGTKYKKIDIDTLAKHDGLSKEDFLDWFFPNGTNGEIAACILHFTDFRY